MGSLIDSCAQQGISESFVRTAVSRLVASGHLEGQRIGRKSYYRLSETAREEFTQAARLFYEPLPTPRKWLLALDRDSAPGRRWAQLGPRSYMASEIPDEVPSSGVVMSAESLSGDGGIVRLAAELWPLADLATQYEAFVHLFEGLHEHLSAGGEISPPEALRLRLQLVHRFRLIVLQDPRLPQEALGPHWPGLTARRLFAGLYLALADPADGYVAQTMRDSEGALLSQTDATERRKASLKECTIHLNH